LRPWQRPPWLTTRLPSTEFPQPATYYSTIPQVPDRAGQPRRYDVSSLRETKKRLEMAAGQGSAVFDEIAVDLLDDCVDLASDRTCKPSL
jgi:hypothetical protein